MTIDEMIQGGEDNAEVILERTRPTVGQRLKQITQTFVGVIFPWMLPPMGD